MPFSGTTIRHTTEYWTEFYERSLKPLIEKNPAIAAHRSEALRGDILSQIITDLIYSDIVVADLTDSNPNVYWELGVRQSFSHRTITIIESGQYLPFDLAIKGTLPYYPQNSSKMKTFETRFLSAINDCLEHPKIPDSHVLQAISGRGTVYEIVHREETERRLTAILSELAGAERVLRIITRIARRNERIKDPKNWTFVTARFRVPAIELLITNRYLDASDAFFNKAERTYRRIVRWNEQLPIWQLRPERTQRWIVRELKEKKSLRDTISDFKKKVTEEREALQHRL
jgi:hypothetical protein